MDETPRPVAASAPVEAHASAPSAWPRSVQLALGLLLTAGIFFTLGRWSSGPVASPQLSSPHQPSGPRLDLNRATKAELRLLPGLGDTLAQRIVDHRAQHGAFARVDDLGRVSGVGPKTLERLRPWMIVLDDDFDDDMPATSKAVAVMTPSAKPAASRKEQHLTAAINVNRADAAELMKLPGIGAKLSQRIVDERARGAFQSVDELRRVAGIGAKTLDKLRPHVVVK